MDENRLSSRERYIIELINPNNSDDILNIGISNIPEIEIFLENKVKTNTTLDLDSKKVDYAKQYLKKTDLVVADIMNYSPKKKFDKIVMLEVLEHLKYDVLALEKINSLLKDNGFLIISVPNDNILHVINPVKYTQHYRHYSDSDLRKKISGAGFKIIEMNKVENISLFMNLYRHLFFKYLLRKKVNFNYFKGSHKTYKKGNKSGLDTVVLARKISNKV